MHHLIFCRDGVLRRSFVSREPGTDLVISRHLPLRAWELAVEPMAFLGSLDSRIAFEEGLTVLELMENLSPWAETMTGVASMDFPAFLEEARLSTGTGHPELEKVSLRYEAVIGAMPKYEHGPRRVRKENGSFTLLAGKSLISGKLTVNAGWACNALLKPEIRSRYDGAESLSLTLSPMSGWAQLPISIETDGYILDETAMKSAQRFLGSDLSIMREDHPMMSLTAPQEGRGALSRYPLNPPPPRLYDTVVKGFLAGAGFPYSPMQRESTVETLKQRVEDMEAAGGREEEGASRERPESHDAFEAEQRQKALAERWILEQVMGASESLGLEVRNRDSRSEPGPVLFK